MPKKINAPTTAGNNNAATDEHATKVFRKSDHPKTWKDTVKMMLNLFLNLFS